MAVTHMTCESRQSKVNLGNEPEGKRIHTGILLVTDCQIDQCYLKHEIQGVSPGARVHPVFGSKKLVVDSSTLVRVTRLSYVQIKTSLRMLNFCPSCNGVSARCIEAVTSGSRHTS